LILFPFSLPLIFKWCSINADSSSRLFLFLYSSRGRATVLFFIHCAAQQPSFSSFVAPPAKPSFSSLVAPPSDDHPFLHSFVALPGDNLLLLLSRRQAGGRPSISFFLALPGANPFLHSSRRRAQIYTIFIPRAAGRFAKSNLFHFADGRLSRIIPPTGDYRESSRRRAIITHHHADHRL
jgi:hypothetical protein